ncbi:MAG: hypothetical protein Q9222_001954 [Ikaeria aurantiellina]
MKTTRFRGGTPTSYEVQHRITDPEFLALNDQLNRRFEQWMAQHVQEAVAQAQAEYQYHPPPEMLESDAEDETLPYHKNLPSPASTPPPSRPTTANPIQSRIPAVVPTASISSALPEKDFQCACSTPSVYLSSNPGSPKGYSLINRRSTHKASYEKALHPSATTDVLADQGEQGGLQSSSHPTSHLPSSQPPFFPAAADPSYSKPNSPVRRTRQSQPSSITTRSKSSASTLHSGLQRMPPQDRRPARPTRPSLTKKAMVPAKSGGKRLSLLLPLGSTEQANASAELRRPSRATTVSSTKSRSHAGVKGAKITRRGKGKK